MGEEDEVAIRERFFKIMVPGFREKLKLPLAFCEKIKEEKSETAIIESGKGMWEVRVSRNCGDDQIFFKDGWPRFVDEHDLNVGYFLVFEHIRDLHFNVVVFNPSACERRYMVEPQNERQIITEDRGNAKSKRKGKRKAHRKSVDTQTTTFTVEMTRHLATRKGSRVLHIPMGFVRSNNLREKKSVILRDGGRRSPSWEVKLWVEEKGRLRVFMSYGWHHFYQSNHLNVGDLCVFQLDPTSSPLTSPTIFIDFKIVRAN
ncbi:hypothetical protein C2S51_006960 [Perilla frutescens var. frutescens]|nr:hypothetical protein C2S51_006960 [Perilla frutescens var. frutescens]